jgi:ABC-type oligopeptide transport system substrate-binding subunit
MPDDTMHRMRRTLTAAALAATALLALTACSSSNGAAKPSGNLDQTGQQACDDFANGYKAATTSDARTKLATTVNGSAKSSTVDNIPDMAKALTRAADAGDTAWKIGADAFAQACLDAGWKAS